MNPDEPKTKELGQCKNCRFFGFTPAPYKRDLTGPCLRYPPVAIFRPGNTIHTPITHQDFSQPIMGPNSSCGEFQGKGQSAPPHFTD